MSIPGSEASRLQLLTSGALTELGVTPPQGSRTTLPLDGTRTPISAGAAASARADDDFVVARVDLPSPDAPEAWTIDSTPTATLAELYWYSGLRLALDLDNSTLLAGEPVTVRLRAVDREGNPGDLSRYGEVSPTLGADSDAAELTVADATQGTLNAEFVTSPTQPTVMLQMTVELVTQSGLPLVPLIFDQSISLTLPSTFPTVQPLDVLDLGTMSGHQPLSGSLQLTGSPDGPSQVCVGSARDEQVPERAGATTSTPCQRTASTSPQPNRQPSLSPWRPRTPPMAQAQPSCR